MAWGPALQTAFLLCSGAVLLYAMFSVDLRARLKVFIAKHFYRNRYDYREEWLRLIETLASAGDGESPVARGIEALASIVGSRSGELWWLNSEGSRYEARPGWNMSALADDFSVDDSVVAFLDSRRWVIDTKECASNPELYANAFIGDERFSSVPSIFVPLVHENRLTGIVRLDRPVGIGKLGFEDHDLLKTAGQQVAIFLAQEEAKERLSETRQLEAFSKFTTFLMHDLKNVIAQQDLVVANAKRYGDRPEFVEDAIRTIGASVKRMRRILARLTSGFASEDISNVDLGKLLRDVCSNCADREPPPRLVEIDDELVVAINRERLAMALTHAIRNAQDATDADGRIELRLKSEGTMAVIEVNDTGVGMEAEFIHERLFKPFDSTKGAQGMGIGAYQLRETLRAVDGEVEVSSTPGRGTTLRMRLPVDPNSSPAETGT
jgi:putative PEP-CTERM system histidine kinase